MTAESDTKQYKYIDDRESLLQNPDMYIGYISKSEKTVWVLEKKQESVTLVPQTLLISQGVIKIFKEILHNAVDREQWTMNSDDPLTTIKVTTSMENKGTISVYNDGAGIPVTQTMIDGVLQYHATALFSRFKSSSNYKTTDEEKERGVQETRVRFTGGKNGFGAKTTNTFSTFFKVTTYDATRNLLFEQTWTKNLSIVGEPKVTSPPKSKYKRGFTLVEFIPDWTRFGMPEGLNEGTQKVLEACTWGASGCTGPKVKVYYNGEVVPVKAFSDFAGLLTKTVDASIVPIGTIPIVPMAYDYVSQSRSAIVKDTTKFKNAEKIDRGEFFVRFEVCVFPAQEDHKTLQKCCIGFVNALQCSEGEHVDFVYSKLAAHIKEKLTKKYPNIPIPKTLVKMIKSRFFVALRVLLDDPLFDAQTKEKLDSPKPKDFGFDWTPPAAFWKQIDSMNIIESLLEKIVTADTKTTVKNLGGGSDIGTGSTFSKKPIIPKYDPAKNAGTKNNTCILFITEGDSAKTLVEAGISVIGRDNYGIFPIKGKLPNVRDISESDAIKNIEVGRILKIMGVRPGTKQVWSDLNYQGGICGFTDQDSDGGHIMGLLMNLFHCLCKFGIEAKPEMMLRFATPQFRFTPKTEKTRDLYQTGPFMEFTSKAELNQWMKTKNISEDQAHSLFKVNYFKGLGTSTNADAKRYFQNIDKRMIKVVYTGADSDEAIKDMFEKKRVGKRKDLLSNVYNPDMFVDYTQPTVTWTDYLKNEVLPFSREDNERSIAHFADGLKPSQRGVIFTMLSKNIVSPAKVAEVTGKVMEYTHYAHGETSLQDTIVGLAQDFWGTNNINFLFPDGQFGSRTLGRNSNASPRYIFTKLNNPIARATFPKIDFDLGLCERQVVDGEHREPSCLLPVVPVVLINGSSGIGTGWSSDVPCYNPKDVVALLKSMISGTSDKIELMPWFAHFRGTVVETEPSKYAVNGMYSVDDTSESDVLVTVTELPIGKWRDVYQSDMQEEYLLGGVRAKKLEQEEKEKAAKKGEKGEKGEKGQTAKKRKLNGAIVKQLDEAKMNMVLVDDSILETESNLSTPTKDPKNLKSSVKPPPFIKEIDNYECTHVVVKLVFRCDRTLYDKHVRGNEPFVFKLSSKFSSTNMNLWGPDGKIVLYKSPLEICKAFYDWRITKYTERKSRMLASMTNQLQVMSNKARFITMIAVEKTLVVANRKQQELAQEMEDLGFDGNESDGENGSEMNLEFVKVDGSLISKFAYLLRIPIHSLTKEMVDKLENEYVQKKRDYDLVFNTSPQDMWLSDLNEFEQAYDEFDRERYKSFYSEDEKVKMPPAKKQKKAVATSKK